MDGNRQQSFLDKTLSKARTNQECGIHTFPSIISLSQFLKAESPLPQTLKMAYYCEKQKMWIFPTTSHAAFSSSRDTADALPQEELLTGVPYYCEKQRQWIFPSATSSSPADTLPTAGDSLPQEMKEKPYFRVIETLQKKIQEIFAP